MRVVDKQGESPNHPDRLVIELDRETDGRIFVDALFHAAYALSQAARARIERGEDPELPEGVASADEYGIRAAELQGYFGFDPQHPNPLHDAITTETLSAAHHQMLAEVAQTFCRKLAEDLHIDLSPVEGSIQSRP